MIDANFSVIDGVFKRIADGRTDGRRGIIFEIFNDEFGDEASVAEFGGLFGAEQAATVDIIFEIFNGIDGAAFVHQIGKALNVFFPSDFFLTVFLQSEGIGRKNFGVFVSNAEPIEEKFDIGVNAEALKLRSVVEAHVDDAGDVIVFEHRKKLFGGLFRKADRVQRLQIQRRLPFKKNLRFNADQNNRHRRI